MTVKNYINQIAMFLNKVLSEHSPCSFTYKYLIIHRDFPGGLVVETACSRCREPGLNPGRGTGSHMPQRRPGILCATTKTWHSQISSNLKIRVIGSYGLT